MYAPTSFVDGKGRRIFIGWLTEGKRPDQEGKYDYTGALSLPRELSIGKEGLLRMTPIQELQSLRYEAKRFAGIELCKEKWDCGLKGKSVEVYAEIEFEKGIEAIILNVFESPDGEEVTSIVVDVAQQMLSVDRTRSSLSPGVNKDILFGKAQYWEENRFILHVFIDKSIVEVFFNEHTSISTRVYPVLDDSCGISLHALGCGKSVARVLNIYKLKDTSYS